MIILTEKEKRVVEAGIQKLLENSDKCVNVLLGKISKL